MKRLVNSSKQVALIRRLSRSSSASTMDSEAELNGEPIAEDDNGCEMPKSGFLAGTIERRESVRLVWRHIKSRIRKAYPSHKFIGEESGKQFHELTEDPTWIIDPIDGTTNFVHRLPFVCISIALWIQKAPVIGIVYNPVMGELFTACKNKGAHRNGFRIRTSRTTDLNKALLVPGFGCDHDEDTTYMLLRNVRTMVDQKIRGHRNFGSAALNLCYLAAGCVDAFFDYGLHCWDMAAAALIVSEAGGCVMDPSGSSLDIMSRRILCAGTETLAHSISALLTHVQLPRDDQPPSGS